MFQLTFAWTQLSNTNFRNYALHIIFRDKKAVPQVAKGVNYTSEPSGSADSEWLTFNPCGLSPSRLTTGSDTCCSQSLRVQPSLEEAVFLFKRGYDSFKCLSRPTVTTVCRFYRARQSHDTTLHVPLHLLDMTANTIS